MHNAYEAMKIGSIASFLSEFFKSINYDINCVYFQSSNYIWKAKKNL
jgi:hypothetical protein